MFYDVRPTEQSVATARIRHNTHVPDIHRPFTILDCLWATTEASGAWLPTTAIKKKKKNGTKYTVHTVFL